MGVTAIPYIVHFGDSASMPKLNPRTILQSEHVYEGSQTAVSAEDMSAFLRQHTHMHVRLPTPDCCVPLLGLLVLAPVLHCQATVVPDLPHHTYWQCMHWQVEIVRGSWKGIGVVLAVLALALYLGTFYMDHLIVFGEMLRQAKRLWFTVCMVLHCHHPAVGATCASHSLLLLLLLLHPSQIVYFIAISGIVYDVIRVPPPFYFDKNRQLAIFHPQSNQQFMLEGLITGLLRTL